MAAAQTYFVLEAPVPKSLLPLGSLVLEPKYPLDAYSEGLNIQDDHKILVRLDKNVSEIMKALKGDATSSKWSQLLQLVGVSPSMSEFQLEAIECRVYGLLNQLESFNQLIDSSDARMWIRRSLKGGSRVYFVTGYRTMRHGRLKQHEHNRIGAEAAIPISSIVGSETGISVGVAASIEHNFEMEKNFETDDEMIFAIAYSRIRIRKLFGVEKASLKFRGEWSAPITPTKRNQSSLSDSKVNVTKGPKRRNEDRETLLINELTTALKYVKQLKLLISKDTQDKPLPGIWDRYVTRLRPDPDLPTDTGTLFPSIKPMESEEAGNVVMERIGDDIEAHDNNFYTSIGVGTFQVNHPDDDTTSVTSSGTSFWSDISKSSASSPYILPGAEEELFHLFLNEDGLQPWYKRIAERYTGDEFERIYYNLIRAYVVDLRENASSELEILAVKFIRSSARRMSGLVRRQIYSESGEDKEVMKSLMELVPEKSEQLDQILGRLGQSKPEAAANELVEDLSDTSDFEESELAKMPNLDQVKKFLVSGTAFAKVAENLRRLAETSPILNADASFEAENSPFDALSPESNSATESDNSLADPLLDPARYYGHFEALEEEIAKYCQLQCLLDSSGASNSFVINPDLSESGAEQTINKLSGLMRGVLDGYSLLKSVGFCSEEFSLIIGSHNSVDIIRVVPFSEQSLTQLLGVDLDEVLPILRSVGGENFIADLGEAAHAVFSYFGFEISKPKDFQHSFHLFASLIQILALGLVSYSGSHASAFNEKYLDDKRMEFKIPVNKSEDSEEVIVLRRVTLACLHEFVGGPVWAFLDGDQDASHNAGKKLQCSIRGFTDLWGPSRVIYSNDEAGKVIRVEVDRGTIARDEEVPTADNVVSCHWFGWETPLPNNCMAFNEDSMLLIGTEILPAQPGEFNHNSQCQRKGTVGSIVRDTSKETILGTAEAAWGLDAVNFSAGISRVVAANFGGVFKPIPGQSRKAILLRDWAQDRPDPRKLDARIGLEISACTGNALRVPVWELFRLDAIKEYVAAVLPDELPKSTERIPSFLNVFDKGFDAFMSTWENKKNKEFRASAVLITRRLLQNLVFTGPVAKGDLLAWFPDKRSKDGLLISKCNRHKWIQLLADSTKDTALSVMSRRCLEIEFQNGCKHNSDGKDLCTALRTALYVEGPKKIHNILVKKERKPSKLPSPPQQVSKAQDDLNTRLHKLLSLKSKKKPATAAPAEAQAMPDFTSSAATIGSTTTSPIPTATTALTPSSESTDDISSMVADSISEVSITGITEAMKAALAAENVSQQMKHLQEPISAKLEHGSGQKLLQMPRISAQPQHRVYVIKIKEYLLGQMGHSLNKAVFPTGDLCYQELTGDLNEDKQLVQVWVM